MALRKGWYAGKFLWMLLAVVGTIGGLGAYEFFTVKADKPVYLLGSVDSGDVVLQVAATGTLAAVTTVQVGTQVSGTIAELYADFNSEVKKGQILARLDPELFQAQLQQQEANVRTSEASLNDDTASIASAKANLEKAKVDFLDKQRKWKITQALFDQNLVTQDDLDTAKAALDAAVAAQTAQEAQIDSVQARYKADEQRLNQARAGLEQAKVNLEHTVIASPISGTIISRNVDRGQTIAASFSSPTLFTIGEDLTKMQVSTNIDEADVGKIKRGMQATFLVDAYPGEVFGGMISQVRLAATTVQNVVTYNAMIDVANPQLKLKPGMTANVKILIDKADAALRIPNAALRFRPGMSDQDLAAVFKEAGEEKYFSLWKSAGTRNGGAAGQQTSIPSTGERGTDRNSLLKNNLSQTMPSVGQGAGARTKRAAIWILGADKSIHPVVVRLGLTDGVLTAIEPGKLREGDKIVIGLETPQASRNAPNSTTRPPGFGGPGMGGGRYGR